MSRAGARLFLIYAFASLLPVAALGALLVNNEQEAGVARALAQGRAQAAVILQMAVAPAVGSSDLSRGIVERQRAALQSATSLAIYSNSLVELRLRSFAGDVVFADDGTNTDPLPSGSAVFRRAAAGHVEAAIVANPRDPHQQTIRVLQPVMAETNGHSSGVLELYLPYAPIAAIVRSENRQTYVRLAFGLAGLYLVTAVISWSVTRRLRRYAQEQAHNARHDSLTELPNRAAFRDDARAALLEEGAAGAIVLMDLNRFKEVNDTLGHHAGDELLRIVAERLRSGLRTDDVVARLGGDEFGILLTGLTDPDAVRSLLAGLQLRLQEDVKIDATILSVEGSFGVALFPQHGTDLSELLIRADSAMYHGKRGAERIVVWDPSMRSTATRSHEVHSELQRALDHDELVMHYQPKVELRTGRVVGMEALVRWEHPERGLLLPCEFIPAAESSTLITPLTAWVLRRALADLKEWHERGADWTVAVNVSAVNLITPAFAESVLGVVAELDVAPSDLILEITETALATDDDAARTAIRALRQGGVEVALDDFGTGSTGLLQLRSFPVGEIKIDRVFVRDLLHNDGDRSLVRAVVDLAHRLNCRVVAEGVEDDQVAEWLRVVGCDLAQGFYYQRPAPWIDQLRDAELTPR